LLRWRCRYRHFRRCRRFGRRRDTGCEAARGWAARLVVGRACARVTRVHPGRWAGVRASHPGAPGSLGGRAREPRGCTRVAGRACARATRVHPGRWADAPTSHTAAHGWLGGRGRERMRARTDRCAGARASHVGHARSLGGRVREAMQARVDRYLTQRACQGGRTRRPRRPHADDRRCALRAIRPSARATASPAARRRIRSSPARWPCETPARTSGTTDRPARRR
jgi:hypothetical protein